MEHIFVLIVSLFREYVCLIEHDGRKTELANAIVFVLFLLLFCYEIPDFFLLFFYIYFCLTIC